MAPKVTRKRKTPGPPPRADATARSYGVRLSPAERDLYGARAAKNGMNFSEYVRSLLERAENENSSHENA